ncbi:MAG: DUF2207 domain-containing protein [Deltaproteobacteria bacterium]|nr:DUF2207 domain-containing protein [Candidatus Deferrimicrobiaceae bacterium]
MSGSPDPKVACLPRRGAAAALLVLLLILLASLPAPARGEDFTIRSFRADIEVRADSSLRIAETIEAVFHRPRHGLYRDIPFRYTDELGKKSVTPIRVVSVTDPSGAAWKYRSSRIGGILRIRIGDADRFVDGRQVYVITYTVENGILPFPDHDELYWNVTGNEWPVPIESAAVAVTVGGDARDLALQTRCYTGPRGSREEACTVSAGSNRASFVSTREFRSGEGMTIVVGWGKGVVRPASAWKTVFYNLNLPENWVFAAPLLSLGFMLVRWHRKGRDPVTGDPLVVAYAPPEETGRPLLPAEIGALIDERLDPKDITASVVDLAVKRYLTIEEKQFPGLVFHKSEYLLRKVKDPGADLPPFERMLMERLFPGAGSEVSVSDLKNTFYKNLDDLKNAAFESLERMKCFAANPSKVKNRYILAGIAILAGGWIVGWILKALLGDGFSRAAIAAVLSGLSVILFAPFMPVKTLNGVKTLGRIKGFEEFLMRAEKDRLERMNDQNLFEKFLPYAIALGVSDRWAKAFEGIYQEPPQWYASQGGGGTFRPTAFHHSLDSALSTMSSAMQSAPRSSGSGFSGGGSSGGGGGGGGGGSW